MTTELGSAEFWQKIRDEPERIAAEVCLIDTTNLDLTLQRHASLHAWINAAHESARIAEERARWEVTKAYALALLAAKAIPDPQTGKGKTVDVFKAEADASAAVQDANEALLLAQAKRGTLRAMASALEDRRDMLIQISAKRRQDQENYSRG